MKLHAMRFTIRQLLSMGAIVLGLTAQALAQGPPANNPGQPFAELQALIGILNDKVDGLEGKIDDLQNDVDNLSTEVDLRGVTQNWDKKLDSTNGEANGCNSDRFTCLWPDETGEPTAVRDNETGLVWERNPDTQSRIWGFAISHCSGQVVGGRRGWSLPMREQLATLADSRNSDPALPTGHPFLNVQSVYHWSASTHVMGPTRAWGVFFSGGQVGFRDKVDSALVWCVRGGQAYDGQDVREVIEALP